MKASLGSLIFKLKTFAYQNDMLLKDLFADHNINFAGHSMGAANALIAAIYFNKTYGFENYKVFQLGAPPAIHSCNFKEVYKLLGEKKLLSLKQNADPVPQLGTFFSCQPTDMVYNLPRANINYPHTTIGYLNGWRSLGYEYIASNGTKFSLHKPSLISELLYTMSNQLDNFLYTIGDKLDKFSHKITNELNKLSYKVSNTLNKGMKFMKEKILWIKSLIF